MLKNLSARGQGETFLPQAQCFRVSPIATRTEHSEHAEISAAWQGLF
jgi:hypothetical protein